jgi:aminopeptidase N
MMMKTENSVKAVPQTIYLKDYTPYPYDVGEVSLSFDLRDERTLVTCETRWARKGDMPCPLVLNGENLTLISVHKDGAEFTDYSADDKALTINDPGDGFSLTIVSEIDPAANTALQGLYKSGGNYCTQCEAEGFRGITYYPDRPDVLTTFTVRVEADKATYPVLLSNGELTESGEADNGRHYTIWSDETPKPCYLFALVAGDLERVADTFTTMSGRKVDLHIYVRKGDEGQCGHAMKALQDSMKWDEDIYGREYQYSIFNVVAVSDFNMGAMENTSLNIFNTALVLAQQETATDQDFMRVEGVIAHEYFHNWTGNRVTCRDWFQLSLKEGLTVFRDQEFSSDLNSRPVQRIDDVAMLRRMQFPEDSGPLAHPIRPDNYIEINNFYTVTVYEKGAEVIRMFHTLLGAETYRKATDLYFDRFDGMAVTCEDWIRCMEDASDLDLTQFKLWYSQAGTPQIDAKTNYDEAAKTFTLSLTQTPPKDGAAMHIPVAFGMVGADGSDVIETQILHLKDVHQEFVFKDIHEKPVPSILRNFSAPVKLTTDLSNADFTFLMLHDSDGFNRWEAGQILASKMIHAMIDKHEAGDEYSVCPRYLESLGTLINQGFDEGCDKALLSRALSVPDISVIGQDRDNADPAAIEAVRRAFIQAIKSAHKDTLEKLYDANRSGDEFEITPEAMGCRSLQNTLLGILGISRGKNCAARAYDQYQSANNMTDRTAALSVLTHTASDLRDQAFADFYERYKDYALVIDKYFGLQAVAVRDTAIADLKALRQHPEFNIRNPNRVRSLYGAFAMNNPAVFHGADGSGYEFLRDAVIELNAINPQIAARLLTPMRDWRRYSPDRREMMQSALSKILKTPNLSPDVFEIANKSLKG